MSSKWKGRTVTVSGVAGAELLGFGKHQICRLRRNPTADVAWLVFHKLD